MNAKEHTPVVICACFLSLAPAVASAMNEDPLEPVAIFCTGVATNLSVESFDLTCRIQELPDHLSARDGLDLDSNSPKLRNSVISGCDNPGDVFEQGVCLN
ncbi:MAG: hypothetical protein WA782_07705 [Sulfitobacter sp.]